MAEFKVRFTGDSKALKRAAQEATQIMGAAAAEGAAAARRADQETLESRKKSLQEAQAAARQALDANRAAQRTAGDEERARLKQESADLRAEMKVRVADIRALARERAAAAKEAAALEKAAADARRADRQREAAEVRAWAEEQRRIARDLDREAAKLRGGRAGAPGAPGAAPAGGPGGDLLAGVLTAAVFTKIIGTLDRLTDAVNQMNERALGEQERAATVTSRREEAFRLAGASPEQARALAMRATAAGFDPGTLDAALGDFGRSARVLDPEALSRIFGRADNRSLPGALALAGRGVSGFEAVNIAGRFYAGSRGGSITPEIAGQIATTYAGRQLTADEILTNALRAAGVANPEAVARQSRAITGQPEILSNRLANDALQTIQAAYGGGDGTGAYLEQERQAREAMRALMLSQGGRSTMQAIESLVPGFAAPVARSIGDTVAGVDYDRGRAPSTPTVRVENMSRPPSE